MQDDVRSYERWDSDDPDEALIMAFFLKTRHQKDKRSIEQICAGTGLKPDAVLKVLGRRLARVNEMAPLRRSVDDETT